VFQRSVREHCSTVGLPSRTGAQISCAEEAVRALRRRRVPVVLLEPAERQGAGARVSFPQVHLLVKAGIPLQKPPVRRGEEAMDLLPRVHLLDGAGVPLQVQSVPREGGTTVLLRSRRLLGEAGVPVLEPAAPGLEWGRFVGAKRRFPEQEALEQA
jgi:hypothetical protein